MSLRLLVQGAPVGFYFDWGLPSLASQYQTYIAFVRYGSLNFGGTPTPGFPLLYFLGMLGLVGLGGGPVSLGVTTIFVSFSGFSLFYLCRIWNIRQAASLVAGIAYMSSPVLFNELEVGHVTYLMSYSLAPFVIAVFIKTANSNRMNWSQLMGEGIALSLSWAQIQFAFMIAGLLLAYSLFVKDSGTRARKIVKLAVCSLVATAINLPWIVSSLYWSPLETIARFSVPSQGILAGSPSPFDAVRLLGYGNNDYLAAFSRLMTWPTAQFLSIIVPLLAVSALALESRNRIVLLLSGCVVATFFVLTISSWPGYVVFEWLLMIVRPLQIFRELYHLMFILALGYATLTGWTIHSVLTRLPHISLSSPNWPGFLGHMRKDWLVTTVFLGLIVISQYPSFTGNFAGTVNAYSFGTDYQNVYNYITKDSTNYNVAWFPLSDAVYTRGTQQDVLGKNFWVSRSPKPTILLKTNSLSTFTAMSAEQHTTQFLAQLLGLENVGLVITGQDFRAYYSDIWNNTSLFDNQLGFQPLQFGNLTVFQNEDVTPRILGTYNPIVLVGDLGLLDSLYYMKPIIDPSGRTTFFASQSMDLATLLSLASEVVIDPRFINELYTGLVSQKAHVKFQPFATRSTPDAGWADVQQTWPNDWHFYSQLEPVIATNRVSDISAPFNVPSDGSYLLWLNTDFSDHGSQIEVLIDNRPVTTLNTNSTLNSGFEYAPVGTVNLNAGLHQVSLISSDGTNAVTSLDVVSQVEYSEAIATIRALLAQKAVILVSEAENLTPNSLQTQDFFPSFGPAASDGTVVRLFHPDSAVLQMPPFITHVDSTLLRTAQLTISDQISSDNSTLGWSLFEGRGFVTTSPNGAFDNSTFVTVPEGTVNSTSGRLLLLYQPLQDINISNAKNLAFEIRSSAVGQLFVRLDAGQDTTNFKVWSGSTLTIPPNAWTRFSLPLDNPTSSSGSLDLSAIRRAFIGIQTTFQGNFSLGLDDLHAEASSLSQFDWHSIESSTNAEGTMTIPINPSDGWIDMIAVVANDETSQDGSQPSISWTELNPTSYVIHASSDKPFLLVFSENFSPNWQAKIGGSILAASIANSFANAYFVNETGTNLTVTIEFFPQEAYDIAIAIALLVSVSPIVYVAVKRVLSWVRRHSKFGKTNRVFLPMKGAV